MLDLSRPRWKKLEYLQQSRRLLKTAAPSESYQSEPWNCRWGSLCHQSDVYTASYAAVSHIIHLGLKRPVSERFDFILMSAKIEAMRCGAVQESFALRSEEEYCVMLGALLIFRGNPALGNMLLDFDGDCQCPNCETVFPPLGYDILKRE